MFLSEFQLQNSTKWWCHQQLGIILLKPRSFLGIILKASQTKFHQIWFSKSKVIHVQISVPKWERRKSGKTFSGLQNGTTRGLQIGVGFRDYKSGQDGLQIRATLGISNRDKKTTNCGRDFKSGQIDFISGQRLQLGQEGFQIEAGITNRCRTPCHEQYLNFCRICAQSWLNEVGK